MGNIIATPSGTLVFTGVFHPHPLPRSSNYHILLFAVAQRTSSLIATICAAPTAVSSHVPAPALPVRSPVHLFQRLPQAQVSAAVQYARRMTSSRSSTGGITCSHCSRPSAETHRRYNTNSLSSSISHWLQYSLT